VLVISEGVRVVELLKLHLYGGLIVDEIGDNQLIVFKHFGLHLLKVELKLLDALLGVVDDHFWRRWRRIWKAWWVSFAVVVFIEATTVVGFRDLAQIFELASFRELRDIELIGDFFRANLGLDHQRLAKAFITLLEFVARAEHYRL